MLFTTRRTDTKTDPALGKRLLMATSALALAAGLNLIGGEQALAQCAPDGTVANDNIVCAGADGNGVNGIDGNDTITVNAAANVVGNINGDGNGAIGNDIINVLAGGTAGQIKGNAGDDTITVAAGGTATGTIDGQGNNDKITVAGAVQIILAGAGDDTVIVNGGTGASINGQAGLDVITFKSAVYTGGITGGTESDKITVTSGSLGMGVTGDEGADTITIGGFGAGDTPTIMGNIVGGLDSDIVTVNNGLVGNITGDEGADTIFIGFGTSTLMGGMVSGGTEDDLVTMFGGTVTQVAGDDGNDLLALNGTITGVGGVAVAGGSGNDPVTLDDGSYTGDATGGTGNDLMGIAGIGTPLLTGKLLGLEGDDTINVGTSEITLTVEGGSGADSIQVLGGSVGGDLRGGGAGEGADGSDTIHIASTDPMNGGEIGGTVSGDDANDTIRLTAGSVGGDIEGDAGDDTIVVEGGNVAVTVEGNEGNDSISMTAGSVGALLSGNTGNDTIRMSGGTVGMTVTGGLDNDLMLVTGGMVGGDVQGNEGNDTVSVGDTIGGAPTVAGNVEGNDGMDRVGAFDGTVGNVTGDAGNDTIVIGFMGSGLMAGLVSGGTENDDIGVFGGTMTQIAGDSGIDLITIMGGTATGVGGVAVTGGTGADTVAMLGGNMMGDVEGDEDDDFLSIVGGTIGGSLQGEEGNDSIRVTGTGVVQTNVEGGIGTDSIEMLGGTVAMDVRGDAGNDTITVSGGAVGSDVQGGTENDKIAISGGDIDGNVEGNDGNDTIAITGTSIGGDVIGGLGNDTILVDSTGSIGGSVIGDAGTDTLELRSIGVISGGVDAGADNDLVRIHGANDGETFDARVGGLTILTGGTGLDQLEFYGALSELPNSFGGFETIMILDGVNDLGSSIDVFRASNVRVLTADLVFVDFVSTLEASNGAGGLGGDLTITGNLAQTGFLDMQDGLDTLDEVTVNGNFASGTFNVFRIDASLDAANDADLLTILGGVTDVSVGAPVNTVVPEGNSVIFVDDVGSGIGILTGDGPGAGIAVVDVSNTGNTDDDDFTLSGEPIQAGAVEYFLDLETDGIWYLQSVFQDQVFGYAGTQSAVLYMAHDYLGTLQERVGTREQQWTGGATAISDGMGIWLRGGGSFGEVTTDPNAGSFGLQEYDYDHFFGQLGVDVPFAVSETGRLVASAFGQAGTATVDALDESGNDASTADITAYGGGVSLTWYGGGEDWAGQPGPHAGAGLYADLIAVFNWYDADVSDTAGADQGHKGTVEGWGWGAGLEVGYGFFLNNGLRLVPQAQISYTAAYLDDFIDEDGIAVDYGTTDSLEGRIGLQVDSGKLWRSGNAYVEANIVQEFLGDNELAVSTLDAGTDIGGTSAELGLGGSFSFVDNVGAYVEIDYRIPFDNGRQGVGVIGGIKVNW